MKILKIHKLIEIHQNKPERFETLTINGHHIVVLAFIYNCSSTDAIYYPFQKRMFVAVF